MENFYCFPNRTLCDVLEELRKCYETRNFSYSLGLIEEVQSLANRMESALSDKKNIEDWTKRRKELKEEIKKLTEQVNNLKK